MSSPNRTTLFPDFHIWKCFLPHPHPPRSTFGYTVLSLQPPSWCLLNLGGHTIFLSLLISRKWSVVLELCSHRRDFVSSASLFGAPFSFRCSPCQILLRASQPEPNQINFSTAGISSAYGIMTPLTFLLLGKYLSVQLYEASGRERVWAWEATLTGQGRKILHFQDHVLLNLIWRLDVCQAPASQWCWGI